ncbi:MAG: hydroxymethylglutaryl-CoA reductase, partial [Caldilineaceae bacterium]
LYTFDSLKNTAGGVVFSLKNRLSDATVTAVHHVKFDDVEVPRANVQIDLGNGTPLAAAQVQGSPIDFPLRKVLDVHCAIPPLAVGKHKVEVKFDTKPFGTLTLKVEGAIQKEVEKRVVIPRDRNDDYSPSAIGERLNFITEHTGATLDHVTRYSFDTQALKGNIEHFVGVAQIPIGIAGPIVINGEHAQGEFIVPMATTEGTLVASYNRGMKVINLSGGCKVTISGDAMQRAPVFVFDDAVQARDFARWVDENFATIAEQAEATSSVARLQNIEPFLAAKFTYLRFSYSTGDAAGQNMVGRATFAACSWILDNYQGVRHFYLESNLATDKKASQVNIMRTRGKRVIAEATVKRDVLVEH